jgi:hypothetical protein
MKMGNNERIGFRLNIDQEKFKETIAKLDALAHKIRAGIELSQNIKQALVHGWELKYNPYTPGFQLFHPLLNYVCWGETLELCVREYEEKVKITMTQNIEKMKKNPLGLRLEKATDIIKCNHCQAKIQAGEYYYKEGETGLNQCEECFHNYAERREE